MSPVTARSRTTDKRYYGVVEAIVTDVNDPKNQGRVKVKFPWFDDQMVSEWCRVRHEYAGDGFGMVFTPEVGTEVLAAFIHGDMRIPIILGGLHNGKDADPVPRDDTKDQKLIRTKGKHEILFDDSSGDQRVRLKTNGGHTANFDDKDKKVTISSTSGHTIVLDDQNGKILIQTAGNQKVEMADQSSTITIQTGGQTIVLDSSGVKIQATQVVVEAPTIQLGGSGATQQLVLGTAFMALFNAHVHNATAILSPTSPPLTPMTPALLSTVSKTV